MARRNTSARVRMRHPKANREYNAPPSAVGFWKSRGWEVVDEHGKPKTQAPASAKAADKSKEG